MTIVLLMVALRLQAENPGCFVCLVTKDINMRLKAKGLLHVEDYCRDRVLDDINITPLTSGLTYLVDRCKHLPPRGHYAHQGHRALTPGCLCRGKSLTPTNRPHVPR